MHVVKTHFWHFKETSFILHNTLCIRPCVESTLRSEERFLFPEKYINMCIYIYIYKSGPLAKIDKFDKSCARTLGPF